MKKEYEIPVAEELVVLQETAFLTGSDVTGRADNGYEDNEMEGLQYESVPICLIAAGGAGGCLP